MFYKNNVEKGINSLKGKMPGKDRDNHNVRKRNKSTDTIYLF